MQKKEETGAEQRVLLSEVEAWRDAVLQERLQRSGGAPSARCWLCCCFLLLAACVSLWGLACALEEGGLGPGKCLQHVLDLALLRGKLCLEGCHPLLCLAALLPHVVAVVLVRLAAQSVDFPLVEILGRVDVLEGVGPENGVQVHGQMLPCFRRQRGPRLVPEVGGSHVPRRHWTLGDSRAAAAAAVSTATLDLALLLWGGQDGRGEADEGSGHEECDLWLEAQILAKATQARHDGAVGVPLLGEELDELHQHGVAPVECVSDYLELLLLAVIKDNIPLLRNEHQQGQSSLGLLEGFLKPASDNLLGFLVAG
mmetsp:Transcript_10903/g.31267  ORF Transcript_10903/g.31267 Transcript_10903/m.31267 type:complete len:312 (-) Transcript_10903:2315-3250(-)